MTRPMVVAVITRVLLGCSDPPPSSTDAGSGEISSCCDYFIFPPAYDEPRVCLRKLTPPGECRWLTCLGGLLHYRVCAPD